MAKDVDLSSKEWRDIVFEGKNKDFGAYEMRKKSDGRHNKAMIIVLIAVVIIFFALRLVNLALEQAAANIIDEASQEIVQVDMGEQEEPEEEEEIVQIEEEKPEALPEEILNTMKVTELQIANDEDVKAEDEIKSQDELQESQTAFGSTDFDKGTDDLNVVREHKDEIIVEKKEPEKEKEKVFVAVEQMPQFPGGDAELMKFLSKNIKYPTMAMENNIQGRVVVQFVVTKTGAIGEVKVIRSVDRDLDREAIRVCKSLPNFIPGKMNGQAVNVWYTLPVNFKLQGVN